MHLENERISVFVQQCNYPGDWLEGVNKTLFYSSSFCYN